MGGGQIDQYEEEKAKNAGLVVVFGASDDLIEFRGCIYDEAYGPGSVQVGTAGVLPEWEQVDHEDEKESREWHERKKSAWAKIDGVWCPKKDGKVYTSWLIDAEMLETATFDIMEDGELFCRGIVFEFAQLAVSPEPA